MSMDSNDLRALYRDMWCEHCGEQKEIDKPCECASCEPEEDDEPASVHWGPKPKATAKHSTN